MTTMTMIGTVRVTIDGEFREITVNTELELPPGCSVGEALTGCSRDVVDAASSWAQGLTPSHYAGKFVDMEIERNVQQVVAYRVGCEHVGRYPQTDPYQVDINDDHALYLLCDDCAYESAQDI